MNIKHSTNFTVMPGDTNPMFPLIFGGAFFSKLDLCAAQAAKRLLYDSETSRTAVTHKFEGTFLMPCYAGDLIFLEAEVKETRKKAIVVDVRAYRERGSEKRDLVAEAKFVFIAITKNAGEASFMDSKPALLPYVEHGVSLVDKPKPAPAVRGSDYFG